MAQSKTTSRTITRTLLKGIGLATAASMVLVAPNSAILLDQLMNKHNKKQARAALAQLKYRKLVDVKKVKGHYEYRLTSRGQESFRKIQLEDMSIPIPKRLW